MQTGGVKQSQNFADIIYACPTSPLFGEGALFRRRRNGHIHKPWKRRREGGLELS